MDKRVYYIWLSMALGAESKLASLLLEKFGNAENVYKCESFGDMTKMSVRQQKALENKSLEEALRVFDICKRKSIGILTPEEECFPDRLRIISAPPTLLYYRGQLRNLNDECLISIVGTRTMTDYGKSVTRCFSRAFACAGAVVVSGMASGVDGEAHRGCMEENGYTVAVLGTAIDKPYPRENEKLYYDIMENGLVISEFYPGCPSSSRNFPIRNRLISGLSSSTVVTEAGEHSGALITAKLAIMQGKDVFALPGLTGSPQSAGTNMLLQKGVNLAYRPADVLLKSELLYPGKIRIPQFAYKAAAEEQTMPKMEFFVKKENKRSDTPKPKLNKSIGKLEPCEEAIVTVLEKSSGPLSPDEIVMATGLDAGDMMSALTVLELYGITAADEFGRYRLV